MKKITLLFTLLIFTFAFSPLSAQDINFDPTATDGTGWVGFMNVFELPSNGGGYVFGSGWGTADLVAQDNLDGTVSLKPNRINDPALEWQGTAPVGDPTGNRIMEAAYYVENDALAGTAFTFNGEVLSNTLNDLGLSEPITYQVFIKVFASDYSSFVLVDSYNLAAGNFTLSALAGDSAIGDHVQYGFNVVGPNIRLDTDVAPNPGYYTDDYNALGSIDFGPNMTLSTNNFDASEFKAYPNPTNSEWTITSNNQIQSIEVYDILGKLVITQEPNDINATINAALLSNGVYIAKINAANGETNIRLIKE
ncbi:MAG: T9SS type A sorting domain-containing protein [Bacteroidia bacterium]|nr:T9SS type A sorting domain-containing protein [Bacteroidia bacterium]